MNAARGYIDSLQMCKENPKEVEVVWIVFKDKSIGKRLRFDLKYLQEKHKPNQKDAVPVLRVKRQFTINKGEVRFQRHQFPLTWA